MARSATWILLVSLTATPAAAQEAGSFSDLSRLVEAGHDVRVTLSGGRDLRARIVGVTPDTLSVLASGARRDLGEADVWAVAHRQDDSNANGAWTGFGAGAALGMYLSVRAMDRIPSDAGDWALAASAAAAAGGAARPAFAQTADPTDLTIAGAQRLVRRVDTEPSGSVCWRRLSSGAGHRRTAGSFAGSCAGAPPSTAGS